MWCAILLSRVFLLIKNKDKCLFSMFYKTVQMYNFEVLVFSLSIFKFGHFKLLYFWLH